MSGIDFGNCHGRSRTRLQGTVVFRTGRHR
jgi:hypothetical protein